MQVSELLPLALKMKKEAKEILSHYLQASEDRNDTITPFGSITQSNQSKFGLFKTVFLFHLRRNLGAFSSKKAFTY